MCAHFFLIVLRRLSASIFLLLGLSFAINSFAHEARPAHLEIKETIPGNLSINWTRPVRDGRVLAIHPVFPESCRAPEHIASYQVNALMHERWQLDCELSDLSTGQVKIVGLDTVLSDVLLRYENSEGEQQLVVLGRKNPAFMFRQDDKPAESVAPYYFKLGVEHILSGPDHLVFVLGLLLLISGLMNLFKTITAFTIAHSITLALAILGYVNVPSAPVEALIALSIVFLARELLSEDENSFSRRLPWFVAAGFGLVHGLGFAGGLAEIGLPQTEIPMALFMFNLGVEAGQLLFVAAMLLLFILSAKFARPAKPALQWLSSYAIGGVSCFWLIERISGF